MMRIAAKPLVIPVNLKVIVLTILLYSLLPGKLIAQNQTVSSGSATAPINFSTSGCLFKWVNDNPSVGLPASGTGNIASFYPVNTGNTPVTATITGTPVLINYAYIPNQLSNNVTVINTDNFTITNTIQVGLGPICVTVKPDNSTVYIGNHDSKSVSIINTISEAVVYTVALPIAPDYMSISGDGQRLYVTSDTNLAVVDLSTNTVLSNTYISSSLVFSAISPDGSRLYISTVSGGVKVISTATSAIINTIGPASGAGIAISLDGSRLYVADATSALYVVNIADNTTLSKIPLKAPYNLALSKDGLFLFVAGNKGIVTTIKTSTNTIFEDTGTVGYGGTSTVGLSVTSDGSQLFIVSTSSNSVLSLPLPVQSLPKGTPVGSAPVSRGTFTVGGVGCNTTPVSFKITINPMPVISNGTVSGIISSDANTPSADPNVQQFTVSGTYLTNDITVTAPAGFEVSLTPGGGYNKSLIITSNLGSVSNTIVYVRSSASAVEGVISGNIVLSSIGALAKNVAVSGMINEVVNNGDLIPAINFPGTGCIYNWANSNTSIGLAASGTGNIAPFLGINTSNVPIVAKITAIPQPGNFVYFTSSLNTNSVFNTANNSIVKTITVGAYAYEVNLNPNKTLVYVSNASGKSISVVSVLTNTVVKTINMGDMVWSTTFSPDGAKLYAVTGYGNQCYLSVYDIATDQITNRISVGSFSYQSAISPDGSKVYVRAVGVPEITIVDVVNKAVVGHIPIILSGGDDEMVVSPDGTKLFVALNSTTAVSIYSTATNTLIGSIPHANPTFLALSADSSKLYISGGNVPTTVASVATGTVISTLATVGGLTAESPDGTQLCAFQGTGLAVTDTRTNITQITPVGAAAFFGNFVSGGVNCSGNAVTFNITINPAPTITAGAAIGNITTCAGAASVDPNVLQFALAGNNLTGDVTVTAPTNFEISTSATTGYSNTITVTQTGGNINSANVYVRASASAPAAVIGGNVILTSSGAASVNVAVTGTVNALPVINPINTQTATDGVLTAAITFSGTAESFSWTNDNTAVGLPASGVGNIPAFIPINKQLNNAIAHITVTPLSAVTGCSGAPVGFNISVNQPPPLITAGAVNGAIAACAGSPSSGTAVQQFVMSGAYLTNAIIATAPAGFEISLSLGSGYNQSITMAPSAGVISNTTIFVRSSASAPAGNISGNIIISSTGASDNKVAVSGVINPLPSVQNIASNTFNDGDLIPTINFAGTADVYNWTNDNPAIGLAASGIGNIQAFTAVNKQYSAVTAHLTVTPVTNTGNCNGPAVSFNISVNPPPPAIKITAGTLSTNTTYGTASPSVSFNLSGDYLKAGILVTPPTGFEISSDALTFGNTILVPTVVNIIGQTTIYIRLKSTTPVNVYSGNVLLTSSGAADAAVIIGSSQVNPAVLTITANDVTKAYGTALSPITSSTNFISTGLKNGEVIGQVSIGYGAGAAAGAAVGNYTGAVNASLPVDGTFDARNYAINYIPGNLTVESVPLIITADDKSKFLGAPNPVFTITYKGFLNNDTPLNLITGPTVSSVADGNSPVGQYPIIVAGATSKNYQISYVSGILTINPAFAMLAVPNAFTPNGDGINDTWHIANLNLYPTCTVQIMNRFGQQLFYSTGYVSDWDGRYKGAYLPTGTYYYIIREPNSNKVLSGQIALIR